MQVQVHHTQAGGVVHDLPAFEGPVARRVFLVNGLAGEGFGGGYRAVTIFLSDQKRLLQSLDQNDFHFGLEYILRPVQMARQRDKHDPK